jgi:chemotaxis protein methyltransferase CheR
VSSDNQCITFLQWALPQLRMRWPGFRKVRHQVCKRVHKRILALGLTSLDAYRFYLTKHPDEGGTLDALCRITISRFYRDKALHGLLERHLIPEIAEQIRQQGMQTLRIWSAGCASGEEPYSLAILWRMQLAWRFQDIDLKILATDADLHLLQRARTACYEVSSLKDLPEPWREAAFTKSDRQHCLHTVFKKQVLFAEHDVRNRMPTTAMHMILCRNLVYTYYTKDLQREITQRFHASLLPGGTLVLGTRETLPDDCPGFTLLSSKASIYRKCLFNTALDRGSYA